MVFDFAFSKQKKNVTACRSELSMLSMQEKSESLCLSASRLYIDLEVCLLSNTRIATTLIQL